MTVIVYPLLLDVVLNDFSVVYEKVIRKCPVHVVTITRAIVFMGVNWVPTLTKTQSLFFTENKGL